ncbi:MAG: hypothetical protein O2921_04640 [Chloroflexi bacterium]|nr:hypothetical protein [Chloroflexota bacterium]MDA1281897.1 hypothetical protein [Chloroflexota bacterium]
MMQSNSAASDSRRLTLIFPTSADQITSEWLSSAFEASGEAPFPVSVHSIEVFPEGLSATGTLAQVFVSYPGVEQGPATLIAKLPDPEKANQANAATYEREITVYRELGADVGVRVPTMYFGASASNSAIMLLEDLSPAVPGDSTTGCSFDEAVAGARRSVRHWSTSERHSLEVAR